MDVTALYEYFKRLREVMDDTPKSILPPEEKLAEVVMDAIRPARLQDIVRDRAANGLPPQMVGTPEPWRKLALTQLRPLRKLILENARVTKVLTEHAAAHGGHTLHHGAPAPTARHIQARAAHLMRPAVTSVLNCSRSAPCVPGT